MLLARVVVGVGASLCALLLTNTLQAGRLEIQDSLLQFSNVNGTEEGKHVDVDVIKLLLTTKFDFTQLYLRAEPISISQLSTAIDEYNGDRGGYYEGHLMPLGVCYPLSRFISNRLFGPGTWRGKAFKKESNIGVNLFNSEGTESDNDVRECREFILSESMSVLDGKPCLALDYYQYNRLHPVAFSMKDELRRLDKDGKFLIGCGGLGISGGIRNFSPFLLVHNPKLVRLTDRAI